MPTRWSDDAASVWIMAAIWLACWLKSAAVCAICPADAAISSVLAVISVVMLAVSDDD